MAQLKQRLYDLILKLQSYAAAHNVISRQITEVPIRVANDNEPRLAFAKRVTRRATRPLPATSTICRPERHRAADFYGSSFSSPFSVDKRLAAASR
jgi:hypothetical protein